MSSSSLQAVPDDLPPDVRLAALRSELDQVDDTLHDALMRRAALVAQVAALRAKGPVPLRPGREAAIIRRLLARNRGALDPALLVRIWREMISGFTVQQQPIVVAVDDPALRDVVSAHFGLLTSVDFAEAPMDRVLAGQAAVAVLRWPGDWWAALLTPRAAALHVVARLPFWGAGAEAMVLTQAAPDPSGDDRTLIAAPAPVGRGRVLAGGADGPFLIELDGFIAAEDAASAGHGARVIGAYATQMGDTG